MTDGIVLGVHGIFPADEDDNKDPFSLKKMKRLESMWILERDILGLMHDGMSKTVMLDKIKRDSLLVILHSLVRNGSYGSRIPFVKFQLVISNLRHSFIVILSGKGLLLTCNTVLRKQPSLIFS